MKSNLLRQILSALCIGLLSVSPVLSQEYQFQNFNELNGLPSSETYHMIQDRDGFIWVASDNGVAKYDGEKFQHYSIRNGLTDNTVFGFFEDGEGRIWFRTYSGALSYFHNGTIFPYRYNAQLKDTLHGGLVSSLVVEDNRLWFSTLGRTPAGFVDSKGSFTILEKVFEGAYLYLYTFDRHRSIVGINGRGTIQSIKADGKFFPFTINSAFFKGPVAVQVWREGTCFFGANREIFKYRDGKVERVQQFRDQVISLSVDYGGNIWVGFFNGGVRKYEDADFTDFSTIPELQDNSVTTVLQDTEGGYWFSTLDRGIFYFPNLRIRIKKFADDLSKLSVVARGKSRVYVGDYSGKVKALGPRLDEATVIHEDEFPVSALFEDPNGDVWAASKPNYFVIGPGGKSRTRWKPTVTMKGFFSGPSGQTCGFYSTGVYALEGNVNAHIIGILGRPQVALTSDSITYVGTLNGLEQYDHHFKRLRDDSLVLKHRVASLQALAPGRIAVGTVGEGLFVLENGKALKVNGLQASNIYSLLVKDERIWAATERGLALSTSLSPHTQPTKWKEIKRSSGLLSDKCNALAALGNNILVFSDQGISVVPENISVFATDRPAVYVKDYEINNAMVASVEGNLNTDQNNITLNVGAVAFNNRELYYRHRVNESSGWSYSEGSNISYFALRPGNYKIVIEASTDNESWHKNQQPVVFSIDPPWWATWTFRGVMTLIFFLMGFVIYRLRINAIRRRQTYLELINSHQQRLIDSEIQTQERERKRIAKDLHDGVGTSLSSIKFMVSDSVNAESGDRTQRVQEINDVLTDVIIEIQRIVYDLHPPALERYGLQVGLKNLADKINNHGGISIMCDYYGHRDVSAHVSLTIYRIVQELVNNTLKHAKASEIRIHVNQFDDELNLMYEDNGIGMIGSRFAGLGLHSIESRVTSLQGRMTWESNHKGTFYSFDIPF